MAELCTRTFRVQTLIDRDCALNVLIPVISPPLNKFVPPSHTLSALVPSKVDTSPDLFGDGPVPVSFMDGTVDRLDLVPSLLDHDVRQIRGRKRVPGNKAGQEARRGEWGGGRRVCSGVYSRIRETDVYAMDADRPVEIRRRVLKVGQQRHPAGQRRRVKNVRLEGKPQMRQGGRTRIRATEAPLLRSF